jgi:hypothetical protein
LLQQRAHDFLRVVSVHLAAESFDVERFHLLTVQKAHKPANAEKRGNETAKTVDAIPEAFGIRALGH